MQLNTKSRYIWWGIFCLMILSINMFPVKGDEFVEGNTSVRNAFEIPYLPFQLSINIESSKEERWFKIELSKPGSLGLTPNICSNLGLKYEIYSEKDLQSDTSPEPLFWDNLICHSNYNYSNYYKLDVGTYYIKIYPSSTNGGWKDNEITVEWDLFEDDGYEPNDSYKQATSVQMGEPMSVGFPGYNDRDWFKVKVDESKALKMNSNISGLHYAIYTGEELQNESPTPIKEAYLDSDFQYWKLEAGVYYYIEICNTSITWKEENAQITFDIFEDDSYEPNDRYQQATLVQPGEAMTIRLSGGNDIDWFKLQVDETISLNLKVDDYYREYPPGGSINGIKYLIYHEEELKKSNPKPILEPGHPENEFFLEENYHYWKLEAGTYYIKIFPFIRTTYFKGMGEDIQITFDIYEEDRYEPNDSYQQAAPIQLGESMPIKIDGFNDVDWFKVNLDEAAALKLTSDKNIYYEIYSEEELQKSDPKYLSCVHACRLGEGRIYSHYYNLDDGAYYILFERGYGNIGEEINITFDLFEHDQYEPNDSYQQATVINLGESINIRPTGPKDVDWFKLTLDEPTAWNIKADGTYGLKYDIYSEEEVKKSNPTSLISASLDTSEDYMKFESGTYYIKVTSTSTDAYRDIILTFDFTLDDAYEYNDTFKLATNLSLNEEKFININAPNDVDYFKFSLEEEKVLTLSMASNLAKTYQYAIYTTNNLEESVSSGSLSTKNGKTNLTLQPGDYYLKLSGNSNNYSTELVSLLLAEEQVDLTRLAVSNYTPSNSYNNDIYRNIEITFNKVLLPSSVTKNQFNIKCLNDSIDFDLKYVEGENKVTLVPLEPLNYASQYTVFVSRNLKALDNGLIMGTDFSWSFYTQEKRPTESQVGTLAGKITLPDGLKGLVVAAKVQLMKDGSVTKTVTPTIDGRFSMTNLAVGTYEIRVKLDGFLSDTQAVTISYGDDLEIELTPIVGDLNSDGIIDLYDITIVSSQYNQQSQ